MAREFEIDVAGSDLLSKNYSIVVSERNTDNLKGFKFNQSLVEEITNKHALGKSKRSKTLLKVRIYCITIYYIFKSMKLKEGTQINLHICRDFFGRERDISSQLKNLLEDILRLKINIAYGRLEKDSSADNYAYIMFKEKKNFLPNYIKMSLEDIEIILNKNK